MLNFGIGVESFPGGAALGLFGELDIDTAPRFCDVVNAHLDRGVRKLVIDLDRLEYIDSRGIYALMTVQREVNRHGGEMAIALANPRIARILTLSGVQQMFRVHASRGEAVEATTG